MHTDPLASDCLSSFAGFFLKIQNARRNGMVMPPDLPEKKAYAGKSG